MATCRGHNPRWNRKNPGSSWIPLLSWFNLRAQRRRVMREVEMIKHIREQVAANEAYRAARKGLRRQP
ncbi:MAG: hypothetical protein WD749_09835 [Phycisphaerales bacterium]